MELDDVQLDPPGSAGLRRRLDVTCGARWRAGVVAERAAGVVDAAAELASARQSLLVTITASWSTTEREQLALECAARARAGVACHAIVEAGAVAAAYVERLRAHGCRVHELPARACSELAPMVVLDATAARLPGLRVRGPIARDLVGTFERATLATGGELLPAALLPPLDASGHAHAALVVGAAAIERASALLTHASRSVEHEGALLRADATVLLARLAPELALLLDERSGASNSRHFSLR